MLIIVVSFVIISFFNQIRNSLRTFKNRQQAGNRRHAVQGIPKLPPLIRTDSPASELVGRLEAALPSTYQEMLKQRVLSEHPDMSGEEYEWRWQELKRFFILCAILERVPMFSKDVDEIWHEMLMYTYEYQQFSERYLGRMLHHAPNTSAEQTPLPIERAWFDTLYVDLFGWHEYSAKLWGAFFRVPLPREELELVTSFRYNVDHGQKRFNAWTYEKIPAARTAIDAVIRNLQERVHSAQEKAPHLEEKVTFRDSNMLLAAAVYFAWNLPEQFSDHMIPEEQDLQKHQRGSSCTSSSACGSTGSDTNDTSSCSSGSSCGSSCGGGCSS